MHAGVLSLQKHTIQAKALGALKAVLSWGPSYTAHAVLAAGYHEAAASTYKLKRHLLGMVDVGRGRLLGPVASRAGS